MASHGIRSSLIFVATVATLALAMSTSQFASADDETPAPSVELGKELFKRDWSKHKPTQGDGLGPMFNAVSCVECHEMGGVGGAGKIEHNVDLLSLASPRPKGNAAAPGLLKRLGTVHPDLNATQLSVTLHKFGFERKNDSFEASGAYKTFRSSFIKSDSKSSSQTVGIAQQINRNRLVFELSQRSTPALFGAGLIDQISDQTLIELARHQKKNVPGISGRVPQTPSGAVGRFGWRGQIGTLHDFVLGACVNELGLQVSPNRHEPENPVDTIKWLTTAEAIIEGVDARTPPFARKEDLTKQETESLTAFVSSLPAPVQLNGTSLTQSKAAMEGERLFGKIGCADCHVKDVGPASGIYSDLLLHDMGRALADTVSAVPEIDEDSIVFSGGYSGGFFTEQLVKATTKIDQEWRTPPLWGVRDSAPYLHDGRAVNLDEAIRMHGGEAAASARRFRSLGTLDRDRVIAFLNTLAPRGAKPRAVFFPQQGGGGGFGFGSGFGSGGFFSILSPSTDAAHFVIPHEIMSNNSDAAAH